MPTPYHYTTPEQSEALARRAARFQRPDSSSHNGTMGSSEWFDQDATLVGNVGGTAKKRLKGKSGLGYSGAEAMEIDPVRILASH